MRKKLFLLVIVIFFMIAGLNFVFTGPAVAQEKIKIGTAPAGGTYYAMGAGMAEILNRWGGMNATAQSTGGGTQNCRILRGHSYFNSDPRELTATFRIWQPKEMKSTFIGFRCARSFWRGRKVDGTPDKGNTSSKRKATGGSK